MTAPIVGPVGNFPLGVLAGDFNGDGKLDLATSNSGDGTVSVLPGNGDWTFQAAISSPANANPNKLVGADFNGDGKLDLVATNTFSKQVSVLLGKGDGTFQAPVGLAVGDEPLGATVADFNGDGKSDLAVANSRDDTVTLFLGNGDGTFGAGASIAVPGGAFGIDAGTLDGNTTVDLAVASRNGAVSILLGDGDGTFQPGPTATATAGGSPSSVVARDFNGDGKLDLAVSASGQGGTQPADVVVLLGHGDGTFAASAPPLEVLTGGDQLVAADFNGDGRPDLATVWSEFQASDLTVLINAGNGTLQPPVTYAVGRDSFGLAAGDWNGDGRIDLATANGNESYPSGDVSLLLNRGGGTFVAAREYSVSAPASADPHPQDPFAIALGDLSGDGILDVVTANLGGNGPGNMSVALGKQDGTFQPAIVLAGAPGALFEDVVIGDFNKDGKPDLAAIDAHNVTVALYLGNGDGTFQAIRSFAVGQSPSGLDAGDFNGDGKLDLAVADLGTAGGSAPTEISILLGNGDGTFQAATSLTGVGAPSAILVGDFNKDGKLDLVASDGNPSGSQPGHLSVLLGNGDGTFRAPLSVDTPAGVWDIASADLNGDGNVDLVTTNPFIDSVTVYLGHGDGTFGTGLGQLTTATFPNQGKVGTVPLIVAIADFNGDGKLDVVAADGGVNVGDDAVSLLLGNGDGTLKPAAITQSGSVPSGIAAADVNGDGAPDVVTSNLTSGTFAVLLDVPPPTLSVVIAPPAGPALAGQPVTYAVSVTNQGPSTATGVVLSDLLPAGATFVSATSSQGTATRAGGTVTANLGALAASATATLTIVVKPTAAGPIADSASVSADAFNRAASTSSAAVTTTVSPSADLAVSVATGSGTLHVGDTLTYTIKVTNNGPSPASAVTLTDPLPAGASFVSAASSQGTSPSIASGNLVAPIGLLASGASATVTIVVNPTAAGSLQNNASAQAAESDPDVSNNSAASVVNVAPSVDLEVSLTGRPDPVTTGKELSYTVTVTNAGPSGATGAALTATLPAGATLVSATASGGASVSPSQGQVTVGIGTLASGATATVKIVVMPTVPGTLTIVATASANEFDRTPANDRASLDSTAIEAPGTLAFASASTVLNENRGTATVTVTRTGGAGGMVTVHYATQAGGTGVSGVDYKAASGVLVFKPGQTTASFKIRVLANPFDKHNETVKLVLGSPTGGAVLGTRRAATLTIRDIDPNRTSPTITTTTAQGTGPVITGFVLGFSKALDPAAASNVRNYTLIDLGRNGVFGNGDDRTVALRSASYDAVTHAVTLIPASRLRPGAFYRVIVEGGANGLTDPGGNPVAGNLTFEVGRGTSLQYLDASRNLVTLRLTGGGTLSLTRSADGQGQVLQLINPAPARSVLSGSVRATRRGASGVTTLDSIQGAGRFGQMRIALTTPPFFVKHPLFPPAQ